MAIAADTSGHGFTKEYLKEGIARLKKEDSKYPTPENEAAIKLAEEALKNLGE